MFVQTAASLGTLVVFRGLAKGAVGFQRGRLPMWEPQVTIAKNCRFREVGTTCFPTSEPWVTIASSCRLPEVGTHASQPGTHRLPLQELGFLKAGTDGSQRGNLLCTIARNCRFPDLKLTVPNLGPRGYHCKELPVPRS